MTWTLTELADLATRALAGGRVRATSGRVAGVPDGRLIRWYTTIGLLDRPVLGPGRVARYGIRQLLQLVAIKRLQAQGLALAQIQARLVGATDAQLSQLAALPPDLTTDAAIPANDAAIPANDAAVPGSGALGAQQGAQSFWARHPSPPVEPALARTPSVRGPAGVDGGDQTVSRVHGLRLGGLTLLLPGEPARQDLPAIAAAAAPLLGILADLGLLDPTEGAQP
ncbi:MAG TPA: MerR family transcriptional regulator [Micromonosporaceae bacterium]